MSTLRDMAVSLTRAEAERLTRINELEVALARMICAHENTLEASEGMFPWKDPHCVYCTVGATPHEFDSGPCAYHAAKILLGQL